MHALPPPKKVILCWRSKCVPEKKIARGLQMRIDAGNMGRHDSLWERREPALGLPFERVWSPYLKIAIGGHESYYYVRVAGNEDFMHFLAIQTSDRRRQGKNDVLSSASIRKQYQFLVRVVNCAPLVAITYVLVTVDSGEYLLIRRKYLLSISVS